MGRAASFVIRQRGAAIAAILASIFFVGCLFAVGGIYNHDEEQYVGAAYFARGFLLYRDFICLQLPLQPILLSAIFDRMDQHFFMAARLFSGAAAIVSAFLTVAIARKLGRGMLASCLFGLVFFAPFSIQAAAGSARNDMLPVCFMLASIYGLLCAHRNPARAIVWVAIAGFAAGAAFETKATFLFVPFMGFLFSFRLAKTRQLSRSIVFVLCACLVMLPAIWLFLQAPANFLFDTIGYHRTFALDWYRAEGKSDQLSLFYRAIYPFYAVIYEPLALAGFVLSGAVILRTPPDETGLRSMLLALGASAVVATLACCLPSPPHRQYFTPVIALGLIALIAAWPARVYVNRNVRGLALILAAAGIGIGLFNFAMLLPRAVQPQKWAPVRAYQNSRAIGELMSRRGLHGRIATLFPIWAIETGGQTYRQWSAGPFFFRSADLLTPYRIAQLDGVSPRTIDGLFASEQPAAIFVGLKFRTDNDEALIAYAHRMHYTRQALPWGTLYLKP